MSMKKKKNLLALMLVICSIVFSIPVHASNVVAESYNDDSSEIKSITIGDIEAKLKEYLDNNYPEMLFGSQEFIEYSMDVLMEDADKKLAMLDNYDDVKYYLGEYLYQLDKYQATGNEAKDVFNLSNSYKLKSIDEIQKEALKTEAKENKIYQVYKNNTSILSLNRATSYSASKAAKYAVKYAKSYNKEYNSHLKDCTNFVSQALKAGGISMKKPSVMDRGITKTTSYWYSIRYEDWHTNGYVYNWFESSSWVGVDDLYKYCLNNGATIYIRNSLKSLQNDAKIGDIVQIKNSKGNWYHSIIITGGSKGNYKYCGHTSNRENYNLSNVGDGNFRIIRF